MTTTNNYLSHKLITARDLQKIGFTPYRSKMIIRTAKAELVKKGYVMYDNPRLGDVPPEIVAEITGVSLFYLRGWISDDEKQQQNNKDTL